MLFVVFDFIICVLPTGYCLLRHWDEYFTILKWFLSRQNITKVFNTLKWFSFSTRECMCAQSLSRFWLFATLWTLACHSPLSMGFSRQEYWSGLQFPTPGSFSNLGIEPTSLTSPALASRFFTTSATWEAQRISPFK